VTSTFLTLTIENESGDSSAGEPDILIGAVPAFAERSNEGFRLSITYPLPAPGFHPFEGEPCNGSIFVLMVEGNRRIC
jgi:hypothetical protein